VTYCGLSTLPVTTTSSIATATRSRYASGRRRTRHASSSTSSAAATVRAFDTVSAPAAPWPVTSHEPEVL
jgi:hypothetical protein